MRRRVIAGLLAVGIALIGVASCANRDIEDANGLAREAYARAESANSRAEELETRVDDLEARIDELENQ